MGILISKEKLEVSLESIKRSLLVSALKSCSLTISWFHRCAEQ